MALSVKAELQVTGLAGGDLGIDGVPWQTSTVAHLRELLYEQLRLPLAAHAQTPLSFLAGVSGDALADGDRLADPHVRGKKIIVRGAELPPTPVRRQWFMLHTEVMLHSLQGASELNGQRATICGWDALKCRYNVLMDATKLTRSVKPDNLRWAKISPLLVNAAGGDPRCAHVPHSLPGVGPDYSAELASAVEPPFGKGEDGYEVVLERATRSGDAAADAELLLRANTSLRSLQLERESLLQKTAATIKEIQFRERTAWEKKAALQREVSHALSVQLETARAELRQVQEDKMRAVEVEDFKLASELKKRQQELVERVKELEDCQHSK
mmetsp:Transcript_114505/g.334778  ORF Transcript_114505/g.334778 Transcript_114505/m.334778 type:complete len:327 (-) Transcript_114505:164-1144(-)